MGLLLNSGNTTFSGVDLAQDSVAPLGDTIYAYTNSTGRELLVDATIILEGLNDVENSVFRFRTAFTNSGDSITIAYGVEETVDLIDTPDSTALYHRLNGIYIPNGAVLTINGFSDNASDSSVTGHIYIVDAQAGVELSASGLDEILTDEPTARATTFREMVIQLWMRFFNRVEKDASNIKVYNGDDDTAITTQAYEEGTTDVVHKTS